MRYARASQDDTRHITSIGVNNGRTLCGKIATMHDRDIDPDTGKIRTTPDWMIRDLPPCDECEQAAGERKTT